MLWDTKKVLLVGAVCVALTQVGNGLKAISYLINVPEAAYAGQAKAKEVDEKFQRYLDQQEATAKAQQDVAEALNKYVAQQQTLKVEEVADDGEVKVLLMDGKKLCCDGRDCWPWSKQTKCVRLHDE